MLWFRHKEKDFSKKIRKVDISIYRLCELLKEGNNIRIVEGIPEKGYLVGAYYDQEKTLISLIIEDESFDIIPEGGIASNFDIIVEEIKK